MLNLILKQRLRNGKEDPQRWPERKGFYTLPRPQGQLIWFHAASVGESLCILPFVKLLQQEHPEYHIMVTTGTITSATLMERHLSGTAFHQFSPMDNPRWVKRFLKHWQPNIAIWVESELWPNLVRQTGRANIPMFLINARMSPKSYSKWKKAGFIAKRILSKFDIIMAQSDQDAQHYTSLLCDPNKKIMVTGNLKWDAEVVAYDEDALHKLQKAIGDRPYWLASSTHPPEDDYIVQTHKAIQQQYDDILTIILPRHPQRGSALVESVKPYSACQRSEQQLPDAQTAFYIADTIGETSLFYALSPIVFMGGSLFPHGGQNMLEPAKQNSALITGPYTHNFILIMETLQNSNAITIVKDAEALADTVCRYLNNNLQRKAAQAAAMNAAARLGGAVEKTYNHILPYIKGSTHD